MVAPPVGGLTRFHGMTAGLMRSTAGGYFPSSTTGDMISVPCCLTSCPNDGLFQERGFMEPAMLFPCLILIMMPRKICLVRRDIWCIRRKITTECQIITGWIFLSNGQRRKNGERPHGRLVLIILISGKILFLFFRILMES